MSFLGIGTLELVMILVLGLLLVGPVDMVRMARKAGLFLRGLTNSELWQSIQGSQRSIKRMGREILGDDTLGLDNIRQELRQVDLTGGVDPEKLTDLPNWEPKSPTFSPPASQSEPTEQES